MALRNIQLIGILAIVGLILYGLFHLIYVYRLLKQNPIVRNPDGTVNADDLESKIAQIKVMNVLNKFKEDDLENLLKVSGNPYKFTPSTWILLRYGAPIIIFFISLLVYAATSDIAFLIFLSFFAFMFYFYPIYYYRDLIKEREHSWNKIYSHIWRIDSNLETNDPKKTCIDLRDYLKSVGEEEMSEGFNYFYECWPEKVTDIPKSIERFGELFPFQLPKDLYFVLLETWRNSSSASQRLENYRRTSILKYEKYSNNLLSKVPSTATVYSLPFLLVSVMAAIMIPALLEIMRALK